MNGMHLNTANHQHLSVSPKLQHAVRLLQMSSLDFSALVRASLSSNPFLETDDSSEGAEAILGTAAEDDSPESGADGDGAASQAGADGQDYWGDARRMHSLAGDGEFSALDNTAVRATLGQHLTEQLKLLNLNPRDMALASVIVESLDEDGYLRMPLDELLEQDALTPSAEVDELRIALRRVQALDPAGVGARDVAECLQLQLGAIDDCELRELAARIVAAQLPALAAHDTAAIAKALHEPAEAVAQACDAIRRLNPRPGWCIDSAPADYVVPDVIARKLNGRWRVQLNPAVMPSVRMNQLYAKLFAQHRTQQHGELADQLRDARWTVRNIEQRFATILAVAQAIVRRQCHFLDLGNMAMKPLGLSEIAEEIGVHESTVSRATCNKFLATPLGVIELRRFFSRSMISANGRACSGIAIRGLVEEMICAEAAKAPLSDAAITRQLADQGLIVARRTVTKYRQQLRIEPVEKRRRMA